MSLDHLTARVTLTSTQQKVKVAGFAAVAAERRVVTNYETTGSCKSLQSRRLELNERYIQ